MPDPTLFEDNNYIHCTRKDCDAKIPNHKWGSIKTPGWFHSKYSGMSYCPKHVPSWVEEWRKRKGQS